MTLQIKTIYKLQLIQNKKTNTTYLEDTKTKPNSKFANEMPFFT